MGIATDKGLLLDGRPTEIHAAPGTSKRSWRGWRSSSASSSQQTAPLRSTNRQSRSSQDATSEFASAVALIFKLSDTRCEVRHDLLERLDSQVQPVNRLHLRNAVRRLQRNASEAPLVGVESRHPISPKGVLIHG
jgi:hypothetical protein